MKRVVLLLLLIGIGIGIYASGLHEQITVESVREWVASAGVLGPVLFVLLFSLEGVGVPGLIFMLTAIVVWPPWFAFLMNWLGALAAGREVGGDVLPEGVADESVGPHAPALEQPSERELGREESGEGEGGALLDRGARRSCPARETGSPGRPGRARPPHRRSCWPCGRPWTCRR